MTLFGNASKQTQDASKGVISPASSQSNSTRPTLLPAFEPVSSSPLAAPSRKRRFDDDAGPQDFAYPTPVPTSSTGILPSSPRHRPTLTRTASALSERSPLSDVPTLSVPDNGQPLYLGRSSNSCDYQLPYNRLISRRHVSVRFEAPDSKHAWGRLLIECLGWNGCVVRCKGRVEELGKDDIFVVADPSVEIILDVMETRVILGWPEVDHPASLWGTSPSRRPRNLGINFASSPPLRPHSPVSPSPSRQLTRDLLGIQSASVKIFEDPSSDDATKENDENMAPDFESKTAASTFDSSLSSSLSENENEENEPLVHSFGPFGADILSKMNSFSAQSPEQTRKQSNLVPQARSQPSPKRVVRRVPLNVSPIKNHVINQLAFSRVHAIPVSQIFKNLPAELKNPSTSPSAEVESLTTDELRDLLHSIPCVGEISRSGKDAAGKALENEFYYVLDKDENTMRRDAVGMGNSGLRSVRKNHKVNFVHWLLQHLVNTVPAAILLEAPSSLKIVRRLYQCAVMHNSTFRVCEFPPPLTLPKHIFYSTFRYPTNSSCHNLYSNFV
jgi:hypothetical protein